MMAEVAAIDPGGSHFTVATFVFILPPGAVMGALMAWAISPPRPGIAAPPPHAWASLRNTWILTLASSLLGSLVIVETMVVRHLSHQSSTKERGGRSEFRVW